MEFDQNSFLSLNICQDKSKTANSNKEVTTKCLPNPAFNPSDIDELKKNDIVGKNQKRYILFVGNLPYDTNREDLKGHFQKCGIVKHIRIPVDKNSNKPRGFAYIELENTETYQVNFQNTKKEHFDLSFVAEMLVNAPYIPKRSQN